jgi:hypothetical protein
MRSSSAGPEQAETVIEVPPQVSTLLGSHDPCEIEDETI